MKKLRKSKENELKLLQSKKEFSQAIDIDLAVDSKKQRQYLEEMKDEKKR